MHFPPHDNHNKPIVDVDDARVPLNYFNIVKLVRGQSFDYQIPRYETAVVPATGTVDVTVEGESFAAIGNRGVDVWDGEPEGVYAPTGAKVRIVCTSAQTEVFIAGARYDGELTPFAVRAADIDKIQYGSDDTKTHRKIKHIFGTKYRDRVGRLLVSELFTVGAGGWSGFPPHKHDTDRLPLETRHDETYNFRFKPDHGFGLQLVQREDGKTGDAYHLTNGSTVVLEKGYHPCVAAPGYEMYYFTILGGLSQRPLVQFFQPTHAYQVETIPGIKRHGGKVQMTVATLNDVLRPAMAQHYAVAGVVVLGWEDAKAYVEAAEETRLPIILQAGPGCRKHTPLPILGKMFRYLAEQATVPVVCHIDHATTVEECRQGIEHGFTSVMIDGSRLPLDGNIALTCEVVALAKKAGVSVEGEIGFVGYDNGTASSMTKPEDAAAFERGTGVDALAISIGNVHLQTEKQAAINYDVLASIEAVTTVPLVLHGGSGISADVRRELAQQHRIKKFNIGTELRMAFGAALRATLVEQPNEFDRGKILSSTMSASRDAAKTVLHNLAAGD